jgi:hypothetical protein
MNDQRRAADLPPWDGAPRDELPTRCPFGITLLAILKGRRGFPAGDILSDTLSYGAVNYVRGGEIETDDKGDTSVVLWVPAFKDQLGHVREQEEPAEHTPLSERERWRIAELAVSALGAAMSHVAVHFGFLTDDSSFAMPWYDYCRHYPHPPEFAMGFWDYDEE